MSVPHISATTSVGCPRKDSQGATRPMAALAPPPTKQGWLHKRGPSALSAERRRWFVLQGAGAAATLRYAKEVNNGHRGTIRCEDVRGVVQRDDLLDIYTPDRTYHARASSSDAAAQWATAIRCAAAGAEAPQSDSEDDDDDVGVPWMIDGAWVDDRQPAPLRTVAHLGALSGDTHSAHVRLADGTTLSADLKGKRPVEVATAGASTLVASLEAHVEPSSLAVACASVALGLVCRRFLPTPDLAAGLLLAYSLTRKRPLKRHDLVLTTRLGADQKRRRSSNRELLARRPSLAGIRSPQQRRPSLFSPPKLKCPDFSGTYVLDHAASDSNDDMMAVLGVPWVARRAIRHAKRLVHVEHDGDAWDETTVTKFRTLADHFDLSGDRLVKISPVDKSSYTTSTIVQHASVVTSVDFGVPDKSQLITRRLDGSRYIVVNELRVGGRTLTVRSVFNRAAEGARE